VRSPSWNRDDCDGEEYVVKPKWRRGPARRIGIAGGNECDDMLIIVLMSNNFLPT
jgi:hypothetical protein